MNRVVAIILFILGLGLVYLGTMSRNSWSGMSASLAKQSGPKFEGASAASVQAIYLSAGVVLVFLGGLSMVRLPPPEREGGQQNLSR